MRRTPGQAAAWAKKNVPGGQCVGYDNLQDFFQHPGGLDAVYISTRPGTHLELAKQVASAGKAVYIEKPVGRCAAETKEIDQACKAAEVPLYTAYISRAYERTHVLRKLLVEEAVGERVTSVTYRLVGMGGARGMDTNELPWRLDAKQSGGGLFLDVGVHVIDRIDYLCGPLVDTKGKAENRASQEFQQVEDYVHFDAIIGTPSDPAQHAPAIPSEGATVSCTWHFSGVNENEEDELIISGPNGSLRMAGMSPAGPIYVHDAQGALTRTINDFTMPEHTAQGLIQIVTDDLRGVSDPATRTSTGLSNGDNAIRTQEVLDAALTSFYGGREIGYWGRL